METVEGAAAPRYKCLEIPVFNINCQALKCDTFEPTAQFSYCNNETMHKNNAGGKKKERESRALPVTERNNNILKLIWFLINTSIVMMDEK